MAHYFLGVDNGVRMTSREASVKKKAILFCKPSLKRLFKTIERFLKATNKVGVNMNITKRLFHVDLFLYIPMQEGGF